MFDLTIRYALETALGTISRGGDESDLAYVWRTRYRGRRVGVQHRRRGVAAV